MDYIPDVDEMLIPPPYRLGAPGPYMIQGHSFLLPTDAKTLQRLLNRHLNVPLGATENDASDPWNIGFGTARRRMDGALEASPTGIKYVVHKELQRVILNVLRYWRVDAQEAPGKGYMAYTELLLQFMVHRILEGKEEDPAESFYFLAAVYIDDSQYRGELQDPHSLPILLGREAYGLPKNPGRIFYCPNDQNDTECRLDIWDFGLGTVQKLALQPAITIGPPGWEPPTTECSPETPSPLLEGASFEPLAGQFGLKEEELLALLRQWDDREDPFRRFARVVALPGLEILIRTDLHLFAKLVGLKQFPDPTTAQSPPPGATVGACYRAAVESAVEYHDSHAPQSHTVLSGQEVEFHPRNRVELADALAIPLNPSRRVTASSAYYMVSNFLYGRPQRTEVWEPA